MQNNYFTVLCFMLICFEFGVVHCEGDQTSLAELNPDADGAETALDIDYDLSECEVALENMDYSAVEVVEEEDVPYVLQMLTMLKAQISETECRSCYAQMKAGTTEGVTLKCFECKPLENPEDLIPDDEKEAKNKTNPPYRVSPSFFETKMVLSIAGPNDDAEEGTQIGNIFFDDENYD